MARRRWLTVLLGISFLRAGKVQDGVTSFLCGARPSFPAKKSYTCIHNVRGLRTACRLSKGTAPISAQNALRNGPSTIETVVTFLVLPALGWLGLPILFEAFRTTRTETALLAVLASKRLFLYALATLAVVYTGKRAAITSGSPLGERLQNLNEELMGKPPAIPTSFSDGEVQTLPADAAAAPEPEQARSMSGSAQQLDTPPPAASPRASESKGEIYKQLDKVDDATQSALLPVLLGIVLAASYYFVSSNGMVMPTVPKLGGDIVITKAQLEALSLLSTISCVVVFSATEVRSIVSSAWRSSQNEASSTQEVPPWALAGANLSTIALAVMALWLPLKDAWPAQNCLNVAFLVTFSRAVAQAEFSTIASLLVGVALYDLIGVFGTALLLGGQAASGGGSAMATVALGKAGVASSVSSTAASALPTWRPGLIEVVVAGRVSDGLGLADIIFPSILMAWAVKRDAKPENSGGMQYAIACVCGYVLGCVGCELFPIFGQAALLCIVPSMLSAVALTALLRNEVGALWRA